MDSGSFHGYQWYCFCLHIHVMFSVPFRNSFIELISSVDVSGVSPLSNVLVTVTCEEFILAIGIFIVVDETDISTGSIIPIEVSLHCRALSVVLHVNFKLSPASHGIVGCALMK